MDRDLGENADTAQNFCPIERQGGEAAELATGIVASGRNFMVGGAPRAY